MVPQKSKQFGIFIFLVTQIYTNYHENKMACTKGTNSSK
jgi:hypothetical protein